MLGSVWHQIGRNLRAGCGNRQSLAAHRGRFSVDSEVLLKGVGPDRHFNTGNLFLAGIFVHVGFAVDRFDTSLLQGLLFLFGAMLIEGGKLAGPVCIAGAHVVEVVRQFCCTRRFVGRNTDTSLAEILPGNLILRGAIFGNILFSQATFVDIIGIEIAILIGIAAREIGISGPVGVCGGRNMGTTGSTVFTGSLAFISLCPLCGLTAFGGAALCHTWMEGSVCGPSHIAADLRDDAAAWPGRNTEHTAVKLAGCTSKSSESNGGGSQAESLCHSSFGDFLFSGVLPICWSSFLAISNLLGFCVVIFGFLGPPAVLNAGNNAVGTSGRVGVSTCGDRGVVLSVWLQRSCPLFFLPLLPSLLFLFLLTLLLPILLLFPLVVELPLVFGSVRRGCGSRISTFATGVSTAASGRTHRAVQSPGATKSSPASGGNCGSSRPAKLTHSTRPAFVSKLMREAAGAAEEEAPNHVS